VGGRGIPPAAAAAPLPQSSQTKPWVRGPSWNWRRLVLHQLALGQPDESRLESTLGPYQPVPEHVIVDLTVRRDIHSQPLPWTGQAAFQRDTVAAAVVIAQQVGNLVYPQPANSSSWSDPRTSP
jgi:hypothetical protein